MHFALKDQPRLVGFAARSSPVGEERAPVVFREFVTSEDGERLIQRLNALSDAFLAKAPSSARVPPESQIDHLIALLHLDGRVEVWVNEPGFRANFYQWFAGRLEEVHAAEYAFVNDQLAALRRADAPHVFANLRESAGLVEDGSMSISSALERWMLDDDKRMLELLRTESLASWVESALYRIGETYGEVPDDIVKRFVDASRRSEPTD